MIYVIVYKCDLSGDHKAPLDKLIDTNQDSFDDYHTAVEFLNECTCSITTIDDLVNIKKLQVNSKSAEKEYKERKSSELQERE